MISISFGVMYSRHRQSLAKENTLYVKHIFNENGIFMPFRSFKEKYIIYTNYTTYIGFLHAIRCCVRKTRLTVEDKGSVDFIKSLKITYTKKKKY